MEQTKQTFAYRQKMSYTEFYTPAAFAAAAILSGIFRYGIRLRNLRLLDYPNSVYVLGGLALLTLAWALFKFYKYREAKSNLHPIVVGESSFCFPHKCGNAEVAFSDIESIDRHSDDDDGDSFIVTAKGKTYEFFEGFFENKEKYALFTGLIEKQRYA